MCYIVFIPRIQRPLRPASVFSMMMMMMNRQNCRTAQQWTCELVYGADTMFHITYFLFKVFFFVFLDEARSLFSLVYVVNTRVCLTE